MSGLMVSLAVVVAAILAVLVLVFSDQPATEQVRRLRGGRTPGSPRPHVSAGSAASHVGAPMVRRGPPPATVLQRQLALPSVRPRTLPPASTPPARPPASPVIQPTPPASSTPTTNAEANAETGELDTDDLGTWESTIPDDRTFLTRARSSVSLIVLLALVGALVALLIGAALSLAELAIQNTVG